ncbi:MAG: hypothetical protein QXK88_02680 [Desulfurococcaceae archaeon]
MNIQPDVLKRLLQLRIHIEGNSSWAFREFMDFVLDFLDERFSIILGQVLEPYELDVSLLDKRGCEVFPEEPGCNNIQVVGIYGKGSDEPLAYAAYLILRGENVLEVKLVKVIDAISREPLD